MDLYYLLGLDLTLDVNASFGNFYKNTNGKWGSVKLHYGNSSGHL